MSENEDQKRNITVIGDFFSFSQLIGNFETDPPTHVASQCVVGATWPLSRHDGSECWHLASFHLPGKRPGGFAPVTC